MPKQNKNSMRVSWDNCGFALAKEFADEIEIFIIDGEDAPKEDLSIYKTEIADTMYGAFSTNKI